MNPFMGAVFSLILILPCKVAYSSEDSLEQAVKSLSEQLMVVIDQRDVLATKVKALEAWQANVPSVQKFSELISRIEKMEKNIVPGGTIVWFNQERCPSGWTPEEKLRGRYAVGVRADSLGDVGAVRGEPLKNLENRPTGFHEHAMESMVIADIRGGGEVAGPGGFERISYKKTAGPIEQSAQIEGTNAPYAQLLACRKESY